MPEDAVKYHPSIQAGFSLGGSKAVVTVLAESLAYNYQIDFLHYNASLTKEQLTQLCNASLSDIHSSAQP